MTDEEVLAELRDDECDLWRDAGLQSHRREAAEWLVPTMLRRLAAARREARTAQSPCRIEGRTTRYCVTCAETVREAVAAERERCAALVEAPAAFWSEYSDTAQLLGRIAARIRGRG